MYYSRGCARNVERRGAEKQRRRCRTPRHAPRAKRGDRKTSIDRTTSRAGCREISCRGARFSLFHPGDTTRSESARHRAREWTKIHARHASTLALTRKRKVAGERTKAASGTLEFFPRRIIPAAPTGNLRMPVAYGALLGRIFLISPLETPAEELSKREITTRESRLVTFERSRI